LSQFRDQKSIKALADSTGNVELRGLIKSVGLADLVENGFTVRGIYVTNVRLDINGKKYLKQQSEISVSDAHYLAANWLDPRDSVPVSKNVTFHLDGLGLIEYRIPEAEAYFAALLTSELVTLAGLDNQSLFDWNVSQALGRTKVNRAIAESTNPVAA
jgi:hypothetical protein